jgi:hypothetical protein
MIETLEFDAVGGGHGSGCKRLSQILLPSGTDRPISVDFAHRPKDHRPGHAANET